MSQTSAEALEGWLTENPIVAEAITDQELNDMISEIAVGIPEAPEHRLGALTRMTYLGIRWWLSKRADDLKQAPLAVAREHLKAEHEAFVREKEQLEAEKKEIEAERKALDEQKKQLEVDKLQFEAEKKIVKARHEIFVQHEQGASASQEGGRTEEEARQDDSEVSEIHASI